MPLHITGVYLQAGSLLQVGTNTLTVTSGYGLRAMCVRFASNSCGTSGVQAKALG